MGVVVGGETLTLLEGFEDEAPELLEEDAAIPPTTTSRTSQVLPFLFESTTIQHTTVSSATTSASAVATVARPTLTGEAGDSSASNRATTALQMANGMLQPAASSLGETLSAAAAGAAAAALSAAGVVVVAGQGEDVLPEGMAPGTEREHRQMQLAVAKTQRLRSVIEWGNQAIMPGVSEGLQLSEANRVGQIRWGKSSGANQVEQIDGGPLRGAASPSRHRGEHGPVIEWGNQQG